MSSLTSTWMVPRAQLFKESAQLLRLIGDRAPPATRSSKSTLLSSHPKRWVKLVFAQLSIVVGRIVHLEQNYRCEGVTSDIIKTKYPQNEPTDSLDCCSPKDVNRWQHASKHTGTCNKLAMTRRAGEKQKTSLGSLAWIRLVYNCASSLAYYDGKISRPEWQAYWPEHYSWW